VVALAEGLQTSFHRIDESGVGDQFRWLTVDLPPVTKLRETLLPASDRVKVCAQSALDYSWMDEVDTDSGVFITAEGLLMYLEPTDAMGLITECARRFPGGQMMFDLPPSGFAGIARRGLPISFRYRIPPMPFSMSAAEAATLTDVVPGVRAVHDVPYPSGRGRVLNAMMWTVQRIPLLDPIRPALTLLEFG
ncbi:MAG: class I SAM-dependent methyltransferase, partial [Mycobacterium sp.]